MTARSLRVSRTLADRFSAEIICCGSKKPLDMRQGVLSSFIPLEIERENGEYIFQCISESFF